MSFDDVIAGKRTWHIECSDALDGLCLLPDGVVHTCITSPPYYGLRNYGCEGQIGLEDNPAAYVAKLVEVFREVRRILHPSGTVWLNLGSSFATSSGRNNENLAAWSRENARGGGHRAGSIDTPLRAVPDGFKPKDLIQIPFFVSEALRQDGWYLRSASPWVKRVSMPESVSDRPCSALEYVFLLAKEERYYFDMEAVRRGCSPTSHGGPNIRPGRQNLELESYGSRHDATTGKLGKWTAEDKASGRSLRNSDFWFESVGMLLAGEEIVGFDVNLQAYKGAHFATFPERLVEPMVLAGTSERGCCGKCLTPWERVVENTEIGRRNPEKGLRAQHADSLGQCGANSLRAGHRILQTKTLGWQPTCSCGETTTIPCTILDPFCGSGTTLAVALRHNRHAIGIELNSKYVELAERRICKETPLGLFQE